MGAGSARWRSRRTSAHPIPCLQLGVTHIHISKLESDLAEQTPQLNREQPHLRDYEGQKRSSGAAQKEERRSSEELWSRGWEAHTEKGNPHSILP